MTEPQRIDYLVSFLEGGNAANFGRKAGITPQSITLLRQGKLNLYKYASRIVSAYPDVNDKWIISGEGEPFHSMREKGEVLKKIDRLEKEVKKLTSLIAKMAENAE